MRYFFTIFSNRVKLGLVEGDMEERSLDFPSTGIVRSSISVRPDRRGAWASNHCQHQEGKEGPVNTTHLFTILYSILIAGRSYTDNSSRAQVQHALPLRPTTTNACPPKKKAGQY